MKKRKKKKEHGVQNTTRFLEMTVSSRQGLFLPRNLPWVASWCSDALACLTPRKSLQSCFRVIERCDESPQFLNCAHTTCCHILQTAGNAAEVSWRPAAIAKVGFPTGEKKGERVPGRKSHSKQQRWLAFTWPVNDDRPSVTEGSWGCKH